jgi:type II secretory pathway component PulC
VAPPIKITLTLSTIALCALFTAHGVTSYTASKLIAVLSDDDTAKNAVPAPTPPPGAEPPNVRDIIRRNAFDPTTVFAERSDGSLEKIPEVSSPPLVFRKSNRLAKPIAVDANEAELDAAITKVNDAQYAAKRGFVDKLLADPDQLRELARAELHEEAGRAVGVKLYGIRRLSVLGKLGIQNGDLIHSINGMSLADIDSALEAFAQLRSASNLKVAITRRGQAMSLSIRIAN